MDTNTLLAFFLYGVQWIFPVFMIYLYNIKTSKLNDFYISVYIVFITIITLLIIPTSNAVTQALLNLLALNPTIYLVMFYGIIGSTFAMYLMVDRGWDFPQGFAVAMLCASIGSYYWEIPTILYNLFTVGYQIDIFLQIVGFLFFFFILINSGWKHDNKTKIIAILGLLLSFIMLYFRQTPPPITSSGVVLATYWNSLYFMTNRFISTMIVIYCVNKNKPMEKSKKNVNY